MVDIKITKGLDIPLTGEPAGPIKPLIPGGEASPLTHPEQLALNLSGFDELKFKVLVKVDEAVKRGQPLVEDKDSPGRFFASPAGGVVREVRRGLKRRLLDIIIETSKTEEIEDYPPISLERISREELVLHLNRAGIFAHIRQRPFNFLADPQKIPRSIFIKALESAPYTPPAELQVAGYEKEFQAGLDALGKLTKGPIHLVYRQGTPCRAFSEAKGVQKHAAQGPHPVANASLHIERIDPIRSPEDVIWSLDARTVAAIGYFLLHGKVLVSRIISIAGPGFIEERTGYFKIREGFPISSLIAGRLKKGAVRLISGNPLTGHQVEAEDFLGYEDTVLCAIPENTKREFMHFFRLGANKYTFSGAYLSGLVEQKNKKFDFSTNQHGEHRPFIDSSLYDEVMPLNIPTMPLVKAVMAEDYDLAVELGLLEIDSEDFALPSFVCPSKVEMTEIIKNGLRRYANDVLK